MLITYSNIVCSNPENPYRSQQKKAPEGADFKNGAPDGIVLDLLHARKVSQ